MELAAPADVRTKPKAIGAGQYDQIFELVWTAWSAIATLRQKIPCRLGHIADTERPTYSVYSWQGLLDQWDAPRIFLEARGALQPQARHEL